MIRSNCKVCRKAERKAKREAEKKAQLEEALRCEEENKTKRNISNRKCGYDSGEEEMEDRHQTGAEALKVYKRFLPDILEDLSKIKDPRNPKKVKHKLTMLMLYGILMFVFHMKSRRETNREVTRVYMENMKEFFPELNDLPHADSLARLLKKIRAVEIEKAIIGLVKRLIEGKKLERNKVNNRYVLVFDGTGKFTRDWEWSNNCQKKHVSGQPEDVNKYYAYVLEASIVLSNGLTIPIMSEFLDGKEYSFKGKSDDEIKQDCERKALKRLAKRLKKAFPNLKIAVTLDGLFANGPVMEMCEKYGWDYMIIFKDGCLKSVWENIEGLERGNLLKKHECSPKIGVTQEFRWANDIDYRYGTNGRKSLKVNVVICEETRIETNSDTGLEVEKKKRFVWLSCRKLTKDNVEKRCNLIGRPRWNIETQNLILKHHGYSYQHCFSYHWEAMKCFHYLMHLGYIINVLTLYSTEMIENVKSKGVRGTVKLLWKIFSGCPLEIVKLKSLINVRYQIRLAI